MRTRECRRNLFKTEDRYGGYSMECPYPVSTVRQGVLFRESIHESRSLSCNSERKSLSWPLLQQIPDLTLAMPHGKLPAPASQHYVSRLFLTRSSQRDDLVRATHTLH